MAIYSSKEMELDASAMAVYDKLSNLDNLKPALAALDDDRIPEDQRQMLDNMEVTSDSITLPGGPVGTLTLRMAEKVPGKLISMQGEGTPVALSMSLHLNEISADRCGAKVEVDIAIPMMLKPMVSGPIQQLVDKVAQILPNIPY